MGGVCQEGPWWGECLALLEPSLGAQVWFSWLPCSLRSSSSKLAQLTLEQILEHLDNLRLNLTNTKQNCMLASPPESSLPGAPRAQTAPGPGGSRAGENQPWAPLVKLPDL